MPAKKAKTNNYYIGKDMISELPDEILHCIISSLSINEIFRTRILSKRWMNLWKNVLHLDFDWTFMNKHLRSKLDTQEDAMQYGDIVSTMLDQHIGNLISCRFKHFPLCLDSGVLKTLVESVVERRTLSSLSLECETPYRNLIIQKSMMAEFKPTIFSSLCSLELTNYKLESSVLSAFESCKKLKSLKLNSMFMEKSIIDNILKNCVGLEKLSIINSEGFNRLEIENQSLKTLELMSLNNGEIYVNVEKLQDLVIDSLFCHPKNIKIYSRKLLSFTSTCNSSAFWKTKDFLENWSDLIVSQSTNIFQHLLTLSIDLDLNNIREAVPLSHVLLSCSYLNTLKINIPVVKASDDCDLPYPKSKFWELREMYYFELFNNLKFVTIKGFTGKEQEVKFSELLITKACKMEKMHIICGSTFVNEAKNLRSLQRGSSCLSIIIQSCFLV